jgi:hypothetical protein
MSCIIGNQFRDIKDGDRYWYENRGREGFSEGEAVPYNFAFNTFAI